MAIGEKYTSFLRRKLNLKLIIVMSNYICSLQLQILQQQVGVLTDSASHTDERYTRAKAENAALQARVHMLEEQLRESEIRHDDRLQVT